MFYFFLVDMAWICSMETLHTQYTVMFPFQALKAVSQKWMWRPPAKSLNNNIFLVLLWLLFKCNSAWLYEFTNMENGKTKRHTIFQQYIPTCPIHVLCEALTPVKMDRKYFINTNYLTNWAARKEHLFEPIRGFSLRGCSDDSCLSCPL